MPVKLFALVLLSALALGACTTILPQRVNTGNATAHSVSRPVQCVQYARNYSGIQIYGDAHQWWDRAPPRYVRGNLPTPGSVLVLSRTSRMTHGHVAVVRRVLGPRDIEVTQSNWGNDWASRRMIYDSQRVQDISRMNDWTSVRFWNYRDKVFGFPYAAKGFIYP